MRFWSYDTLKATVTLSLISTRQLDIALIGSFKIAVVEADRLTPIMEIPIVHCYELIYHRQLRTPTIVLSILVTESFFNQELFSVNVEL